jgi:predicted  nucleic acid-binding Zn-ribbon protein
MSDTPETDAPHPLQYFTLVDIPKEVYAAALALQFYFEQQGQREWQFSAVADRRLVSKLERERDEAKAQLKQAYDDLLNIATMPEYDQDDCHRLRHLGRKAASDIQTFLK